MAPLFIDVTDADQIAAAAAQIGSSRAVWTGSSTTPGPRSRARSRRCRSTTFRRQVEINLTAQVAVTQAMLPSIRRGGGRIVFISSIGGRIAFPLTGAYHAAKFGIEAVGDTFRQELRPWGIRVSIVEPGSIDTPIWERGERTSDEIGARSPHRESLYGKAIESYRKVIKETAERGIPAEKVARVIEHALSAKHPRSRYLVGLDAKVQARIKPLIPPPFSTGSWRG